MLWSDRYATGIPRIDEQHRMIFRMSEDYRAALDEGRGSTTYPVMLDSLAAYCRGHFGFEERCMEEHRCAVAAINRDAHAKFLEAIEGFRRRYKANAYDSEDARALVDLVDDWLSVHICLIDVKLRDPSGATDSPKPAPRRG